MTTGIVHHCLSLLRSFMDLLFPPLCHLCGDNLIDDGFCTVCLDGFRRVEGPVCSVCGMPFVHGVGTDHVCGECLTTKRRFIMARSVFLYEGMALHALHLLKYSGRTELARPLGYILAKEMAVPEGIDLVVPVPIHRDRLRQRGFNHALLLAREVARYHGLALDYTNLKKTRETPSQVGLKRDERRRNVRGAFSVERREVFRNRRILLVDDVYTTGATVNECAGVIERAGGSVVVLTLARAV